MTYDIKTIKNKVDFEIEPFFWISPCLIVGYDLKEVRENNLKLFVQNSRSIDEDEKIDEIIAHYYLECFFRVSDIGLLLDCALWLIENLYSSYVPYIYPTYIRPHISSKNVNNVFSKLYEFFEKCCLKKQYHVAHLVKVFIFESICYGLEWGSFLDIDNEVILDERKMEIDSLKYSHYLCIYLSKDNLQKIRILQDFSKGKIPLYKY